MHRLINGIVLTLLISASISGICYAEDLKKQRPVVVNGDKVEYFTELEKIVAEGNISIEYGTAILTCDRITVFTKTKDAFAEGNVRLEDERGLIKGKNVFYNFDTKLGKIVEANIKAAPYYGTAPEVEKFSTKFILIDGDITTCNLDEPHYRIHAREIEIFPEEKIIAKGATFLAGNVPMMYFPRYVQYIKDRRHGFSFTPGQSKEWGNYLLSAYRFYLKDDLRGILHFDWRGNKGFGGGIEMELLSQEFGNGLFRYYRIHEHLRGRGEVQPFFKNPERYKIEYRHKWDISNVDQITLEINDYSDADFLKHYYYKQHEEDPRPRSYFLYTHHFSNATASFLMQKRFNQFYTETEKLPEIKLDAVKQKIGESPFYFKHESSITSLTSRTALTDQDEDTVRVDTYNQLSYPFKLAFFNISFEPFVGPRYTYYSKDKNGSEHLFRYAFYTGYSVLTKFYRTFQDVKINSFGLEIDNLRHIITPSLSYAYNNDPTLPSYRLTAFEEIDGISQSNTMTVSLENKLQTKRDGQSVSFLTFIASSPYSFKLEGYGGRFDDLELDLEILPNSWLKYWSDAKFDFRRRKFREANFDIELSLGDKDKFTAGYRYSLGDDSGKVFTATFERQIGPKWKFKSHHRLDFTKSKMIEEQEYALARDLHCWEIEFVVNSKKKKGVTFWLGFRCKAFPDLGFDASKGHQQPKT
ncbi:LPS-assembly protein LptD [Candidatus Omnitrophota bacterium]